MSDVLTHNQTFASPQEALAHYGTKGMKWGVRKNDKPAGDNDQRAERYQKTADRAQAEINTIRAKSAPRLKLTQRSRDNHVAQLEEIRDQHQKAADDIRAGRTLTDQQRKILIGAGVAAALIGGYAAYKYVDSGQFQAHKDRAPWKKNDQLKKHKDPEDVFVKVVKPINPGYGDYGTKMNCRRCTFAYELRRRGYDVKATKSNAGTGQTVGGMMNAVTPGAKNKTGRWGTILQAMREGDKEGGILDTTKKAPWGESTIAFEASHAPSQKADAIFSALSKQPSGSRGELGLGWTMGGGHSMAYEVFKGKAVVFDTQTGKSYHSASDFRDFSNIVTSAGHTRLDNKKLNDQFLRRWVSNAD